MAHEQTLNPPFLARTPARFLPGVALCGAITLAAEGLEGVQHMLLGRVWLEGLVLAILLGALVRLVVTPGPYLRPGVTLTGKTLLEIGIVLLGATIGAGTLLGAGALLPLLIAALVVCALAGSYWLGRAFGLDRDMALLIACGNAICGNSAIAAVAPVIGARPGDVAGAISFTAILGAGYVLLLPAIALALGLDAYGAGLFTGLTVYAVPQVIAGAAPMGLLAVQVGTLTKLFRVLMLGPVVLVLSLLRRGSGTGRLRLGRMVPWFIIGFVVLVALRSAGLVPGWAEAPAGGLASLLTTMAMAALGLDVNMRDVARAGARAASVAGLSLVLIALLALAVMALAGVAG